MSTMAFYDVLRTYQDIHKTVLGLAESLDDAQLGWKPANYATSIGFHLWHLARESDYLKATLLKYFPQLGPDFGEATEIWHAEGLAAKWGFPAELGETGVGTGLSDEIAGSLPIPPKAELLDYLRRSYEAVEQFVILDTRYRALGRWGRYASNHQRIRLNLLVFLTHDCRHLGMMECLVC
jgi:hypothetical protein